MKVLGLTSLLIMGAALTACASPAREDRYVIIRQPAVDSDIAAAANAYCDRRGKDAVMMANSGDNDSVTFVCR